MDDCLIRLRCLELAAGLLPLAEEFTDELLGALIEGEEVLRQGWGFVVPAEVKS